MRIFVITKRTLIIAAAIIILIVAAAILVLSFAPDAAAAANAAPAGQYELEVLAGKQKELPIYSVDRDDGKIALTIDAACAEAMYAANPSEISSYAPRAAQAAYPSLPSGSI